MFCRKGALRNFAKFIGNTSARDYFLIKLPQPATLLKKSLWHRCFPVNFYELSKNTFFYRTHPVAASVVTFIKLSFSSYWKSIFIDKLRGSVPTRREIANPFISTHYSNYDWKSISITANSLLNNVKDKKLKSIFIWPNTLIWQM